MLVLHIVLYLNSRININESVCNRRDRVAFFSGGSVFQGIVLWLGVSGCVTRSAPAGLTLNTGIMCPSVPRLWNSNRQLEQTAGTDQQWLLTNGGEIVTSGKTSFFSLRVSYFILFSYFLIWSTLPAFPCCVYIPQRRLCMFVLSNVWFGALTFRDETNFVVQNDEDQSTDNEICTIASRVDSGRRESASSSGFNNTEGLYSAFSVVWTHCATFGCVIHTVKGNAEVKTLCLFSWGQGKKQFA